MLWFVAICIAKDDLVRQRTKINISARHTYQSTFFVSLHMQICGLCSAINAMQSYSGGRIKTNRNNKDEKAIIDRANRLPVTGLFRR